MSGGISASGTGSPARCLIRSPDPLQSKQPHTALVPVYGGLNAMSTEYTDQDITCKDCRNTFIFSAGEQQFFAERQFTTPVRCKPCREQRKAQKAIDGDDGGGQHQRRR